MALLKITATIFRRRFVAACRVPEHDDQTTINNEQYKYLIQQIELSKSTAFKSRYIETTIT
jgi:hypothetical protein